MRRRIGFVSPARIGAGLALLAAGVLACLVTACASSNDPGLGVRTLDCTVVERMQSPPGTSGSSRACASRSSR